MPTSFPIFHSIIFVFYCNEIRFERYLSSWLLEICIVNFQKVFKVNILNILQPKDSALPTDIKKTARSIAEVFERPV